MKNIQSTTLFGSVLALLILLGGGYYLYSAISPTSTLIEIDNQEEVSETVDNTGDYTIERVPIEEIPTVTIPTPSLDSPIVFYNDFPPEAEELIIKNIETLRSELKENHDLFSSWLSLGILWKQVGDYDRAREVWEYTSAIRPSNNISFLNLGDLYHFYLKDFSKSEESFRTAIANDPTYIQAYTMLHELYRYSYRQNTTLAVDILNDALIQSPNNVNIFSTFALYYQEKGDVANTRKYLVLARDAAESDGDPARADLFQRDIDVLK